MADFSAVGDRPSLIDYLNHGNSVKYLFFWGNQPREPGIIDRSCLSQWFEAEFLLEGNQYPTAEHYMMAEKARLFGDEANLERILAATHPGEAKKLGRMVQGFKNERWNQHRFDIVCRGNLAKFGQNPELQAFLLKTEGRVLVEASPMDRIWGVGLAATDAQIHNPYSWRGLNLLGFALMQVRQRLKS